MPNVKMQHQHDANSNDGRPLRSAMRSSSRPANSAPLMTVRFARRAANVATSSQLDSDNDDVVNICGPSDEAPSSARSVEQHPRGRPTRRSPEPSTSQPQPQPQPPTPTPPTPPTPPPPPPATFRLEDLNFDSDDEDAERLIAASNAIEVAAACSPVLSGESPPSYAAAIVVAPPSSYGATMSADCQGGEAVNHRRQTRHRSPLLRHTPPRQPAELMAMSRRRRRRHQQPRSRRHRRRHRHRKKRRPAARRRTRSRSTSASIRRRPAIL